MRLQFQRQIFTAPSVSVALEAYFGRMPRTWQAGTSQNGAGERL